METAIAACRSVQTSEVLKTSEVWPVKNVGARSQTFEVSETSKVLNPAGSPS